MHARRAHERRASLTTALDRYAQILYLVVTPAVGCELLYGLLDLQWRCRKLCPFIGACRKESWAAHRRDRSCIVAGGRDKYEAALGQNALDMTAVIPSQSKHMVAIAALVIQE